MIPPKKRSSPLITPKKRQSNIFELSSSGSYRVSTSFSKLQSRSMDDLDKIGDESPIQKEHEGQNTYSEETLSAGKSSDEKHAVMSQDGNDNLNIPDDELPPPLFPRKIRSEDVYDTIVVPANLAHRLRPFANSRSNTYNTVQVTQSAVSGHSQNGQKLEGNLKHRYANLDGEMPPSQQLQSPVHPRSGAYEEDPYDVLVSPSRNNHGDVNNSNTLVTTSMKTNYTGRNSPNNANVGLEVKHPDSKNNAYDTVILRNSSHANTNGTTVRSYSQDNAYNAPILKDFSAELQDQANGASTVYEHHVPRRLPPGCTLNTAHGNVATVVSNFEESRNTSLVVPPTLPPKASKKDDLVSSRQSATLPSLRSSSPGPNENTQKYSPPVAPRIKKPPRTLPKPRNNNVD